MNIHPLIPEDYPVIDSYMQELHDLHVQGRPDLFIPASHIYSEADFREITTDGNHIALAMTDDHFIAGFIIAALRTKSNMVTGTLIAYVDDMFVHPSYRGQKIATTLFHEMEQKAKEILLEKLEEMAEFTPDTYGDLQGYAVLCSAMVDLYNAIAQNP